jgi:hypothetical protein
MLGRIWAALQHGPEGTGPLPVDPPIGGPVWTVLIPAVLFIGSFLGTYLLYRRFSREGRDEDPSNS